MVAGRSSALPAKTAATRVLLADFRLFAEIESLALYVHAPLMILSAATFVASGRLPTLAVTLRVPLQAAVRGAVRFDSVSLPDAMKR